jgi:hypothetical protein
MGLNTVSSSEVRLIGAYSVGLHSGNREELRRYECGLRQEPFMVLGIMLTRLKISGTSTLAYFAFSAHEQ